MKIVEDYAQRKVDEERENLKKEFDVSLNEERENLKKEYDVSLNEERENLKKEFVINLSGAGFKLEDIAKYADVSLDFVKQTLSK